MVEAENMFEYADSGSKIKVDINLPNSMRYAVFGAMPENNFSKKINVLLDENSSNNYYFVMQKNDCYSYSSNSRFCGKRVEEIAVLHPGKYSIYLELVFVGGISYVKIYQK